MGRGERIRTSDHRYPIPVRYRAAPRPDGPQYSMGGLQEPSSRPHKALNLKVGIRALRPWFSMSFRGEPRTTKDDDLARMTVAGEVVVLSQTARRDALTTYLTSAFAPASSSFAFAACASSFVTPCLTGFGAPSTRSFASLRPRLVSSRTALMT
jgi:hypothetical protein